MKVHLPIVGKATGSSAGLIYQSYFGNTYARSFPLIFHYPDTQKQQKCQFDFYQIQRPWWDIYDKLKHSIPTQCRRNRNVFNELSHGLYQVFMTYGIKEKSKVVDVWGLDKRKSVKLDVTVGKIRIDGFVVSINTTANTLSGKRVFLPDTYNMLLCNITRQELYLQVVQYDNPKINTEYFVTSKWQYTDLMAAYIALSSDSFFSNFYLCGL